jgi:hypothetical protein
MKVYIYFLHLISCFLFAFLKDYALIFSVAISGQNELHLFMVGWKMYVNSFEMNKQYSICNWCKTASENKQVNLIVTIKY